MLLQNTAKNNNTDNYTSYLQSIIRFYSYINYAEY
jgi:hypothetical protein